jgi:hypothetical protein
MNSYPANQQEPRFDQSRIKKKMMPDLLLDQLIRKKTGKNGEVIYIHPFEGKVEHDSLTLFDTFNLHLDALRKALDYMSIEEYESIGFLFEAVIRNAEVHINEVFKLLEQDAGIKNIEIHVVRRGNSFWRPGRVTGLTITRKEAAKRC